MGMDEYVNDTVEDWLDMAADEQISEGTLLILLTSLRFDFTPEQVTDMVDLRREVTRWLDDPDGSVDAWVQDNGGVIPNPAGRWEFAQEQAGHADAELARILRVGRDKGHATYAATA